MVEMFVSLFFSNNIVVVMIVQITNIDFREILKIIGFEHVMLVCGFFCMEQLYGWHEWMT